MSKKKLPKLAPLSKKTSAKEGVLKRRGKGKSETTSKKVAGKASKILKDPKASKAAKSVAASALTQTAPKKLKALKALKPIKAKKAKGSKVAPHNPLGRPVSDQTVETAKKVLAATIVKPTTVEVPRSGDPVKFRNNIALSVKNYLAKNELLPKDRAVKTAVRGKTVYLWLNERASF